jgi:hypothetical protein
MGALPALRAATDPQVRGGHYYGPSHLAEQRGNARLVHSSAASHDEELQRWLWAVSEQSTGVTYPGLTSSRNTGSHVRLPGRMVLSFTKNNTYGA